MDKLFAVIRREYLERVRSRWFLIATLFGPIFFGLLMFLPAVIASREKASGDASKIIIIDATGAGLGDRVAVTTCGRDVGRGGTIADACGGTPDSLARRRNHSPRKR